MSLFVCVLSARADFADAAKLLRAARAGDTATLNSLVRAGADINYIDNTGLSIVCTAIKNNDTAAAQLLQVYGADASNCDQQIRRYNQKYNPTADTGFFSGLSTPQNMTLMAGGAALVVGGVVLLSSMDSGDDSVSGGGASGRCTPGTECLCDNGATGTCGANGYCGNCGGSSGGGTAWPAGKIPYGPADSTTDYDTTYAANLAEWSPTTDTGLRYKDFQYFKTAGLQNYLLMMHGYSPLAHGYMGQTTYRDTTSHAPLVVGTATGGGRPINISMITANGINPTGSAGKGAITWADGAGATANTYTLDKYGNNEITGNTPYTTSEKSGFDYSGWGTVFNSDATATESALAKIIGGWEAGGRPSGDLYGFIPNGQLNVYRSGGGLGFEATAGTITDTNSNGKWDTGEVVDINIGGVSGNFTITMNADKTFSAAGTCGAVPCTIGGYVGRDGYYYINDINGGAADMIYSVNGTNVNQLKKIDYKNYEIMNTAKTTATNALVNLSLHNDSRKASYMTMADFVTGIDGLNATAARNSMINSINLYYDRDTSDSTTQGAYANSLFGSYGAADAPMIISSAGEYEIGLGPDKSMVPLDAIFENYAPALYDNNLENLFMTIVAVQHKNGTDSADTISGYGDGTGSVFGKLGLSQWTDTNGTPGDTSDDMVFGSRKCGDAGLGVNRIDPWCFAAAGPTAQMATAAAAGAFGALKGAFNYMNTKELFALMALTSDGYLLGTNPATGGAWADNLELAEYLDDRYTLPANVRNGIYDADGTTIKNADKYLEEFAKTFGYGLINLERATTPNKNLFFSDGTNIVSGGGNAFWRTAVLPSGVFGDGLNNVSVAGYDVLESSDGSITLPRVFNVGAGTSSRHGIYLGDALGEFNVSAEKPAVAQVGDMSFGMHFSESNRLNNMNGLSELSFGYDAGNWGFGAQYQHHFDDDGFGVLRSASGNSVLSLASDVMSGSAAYKIGAWDFSSRAFSGQITDESLTEYDPAISGDYRPVRLGLVSGAEMSVGFEREKLSLKNSVGTMRETDTILGTYTDGVLALGGGDTIYLNSILTLKPTDDLTLTGRATFANTRANPTGGAVFGLSDISSNSFVVGARYKNLDIEIARPLAITSGDLSYATMDYQIVEDNDSFGINATPIVAYADLSATARETRFSLAYRTALDEHTDGALGMVFRHNPNNTNRFGNESILMLKIKHKIGI